MSSLSSFVSYLSLIIISAVEMVGWESTKISAEHPRGVTTVTQSMDTLLSLALAVPPATLLKPSIIPFSWGSIFCAEEVPGG